MSTPERMRAHGFGLLVIGNEILEGRRQDRHVDFTRDLLLARGFDLLFVQILPDHPDVIRDQLAWAMGRPAPFFCCGGIGATPDDLTRECAAAAGGSPIARHLEGEAILRTKWPDGASEGRMRMIDFPGGSTLIPNPVNQVPGFCFRNGYFVPGFPEMAHPMMTWVLDTLYEPGQPKASESIVLPNGREGDLVDIMERFVAEHPGVSFSSLPRFVPGGTELHLGVRGLPGEVTAAMRDLMSALCGAGYDPVVRP